MENLDERIRQRTPLLAQQHLKMRERLWRCAAEYYTTYPEEKGWAGACEILSVTVAWVSRPEEEGSNREPQLPTWNIQLKLE